MPAGPIKRERIHPRGTMITSWRRREMIREGRPCPRASKTPAAMKATEEIKKLGPIMRRASVPYCISSGSASKIRRIGPGKKMDAIVPVSVTTVTSQGCSEWYCGPCHGVRLHSYTDNGTHSLEKAVAGKVYKGLEFKIQSKGCYIDASKGSQDSI